MTRRGGKKRPPWPSPPFCNSLVRGLCQSSDGVGPCLDSGENRVGLVGSDADLFAAEGHVVDLTARIMALDGCRIPLAFDVIHRVPAHRGGHLGIAKDLGLDGVETGYSPGPCGDGPHGVRFIILVENPGGIPLPSLLHCGHLPAGGLIRGATERIGGQDGLHNGVECSHVSNRGSECPHCRLDIGLLDEISHADTPRPRLRAGEGVYLNWLKIFGQISEKTP